MPFLDWLDGVTAPWRELGVLRDDVERHEFELADLRSDMANAEEYVARIDAATSEVASDLQSVKDALAAAVAGQGEAVEAAVNAELAKLDEPIAALEALGKADDPANPVPVEPAPPSGEVQVDETLPN